MNHRLWFKGGHDSEELQIRSAANFCPGLLTFGAKPTAAVEIFAAHGCPSQPMKVKFKSVAITSSEECYKLIEWLQMAAVKLKLHNEG